MLQLEPAPAPVEDTWNQERSSEERSSFIERRLASVSLGEIELAVD
jgi:hypothetical protein